MIFLSNTNKSTFLLRLQPKSTLHYFLWPLRSVNKHRKLVSNDPETRDETWQEKHANGPAQTEPTPTPVPRGGSGQGWRSQAQYCFFFCRHTWTPLLSRGGGPEKGPSGQGHIMAGRRSCTTRAERLILTCT